VGAIEPIDPIQTLAPGAADPVGDCTDADGETVGHGTERLALADGGYHLMTTLGNALCLLMMVS
jgi:hypothetical protein